MAPSARAVAALAAVLGLSAAGPARAVACPSGAGSVVSDSTHPPRPVPPPFARLRLSLAASHASVLDPVASPLRYAGGGPAGGVAIVRSSPNGALELSVEVARPTLRSALSSEPDGPRESTVFSAGRALWLRRVGGSPGTGASSTGFLLGVEGRFEGSLRDHRYREPALHFFYGLALASLGPAVRWRADGGRRGELSLEAAAPLLGLAYRPYGDLAYARSGVRPRVAAPPSLAALDAGASWAVPLGRTGARAVAEWRLAYLAYRDHDLYRSARQRFGLGLDLAAGGGR